MRREDCGYMDGREGREKGCRGLGIYEDVRWEGSRKRNREQGRWRSLRKVSAGKKKNKKNKKIGQYQRCRKPRKRCCEPPPSTEGGKPETIGVTKDEEEINREDEDRLFGP